MNNINIINNNINIKESFGDFSILNEVDIIDHPSIYDFAKIVSNYLKMERIYEKEKTK